MAVHAAGTLLATDTESRTLTYRLLPYGEPGRTSIGVVTVPPGVISLPDSPIVLNREHDRTQPVGRSISVSADEAGLTASFRIAGTTAGSDLLIEAAEGLRPGISVELDAVIVRDGQLVAGRLVAAAAVTSPAYPSALLVARDYTDATQDPTPQDPTPQDPTTQENGTMPEPTQPTEPTTQPTAAGHPAHIVVSDPLLAPASPHPQLVASHAYVTPGTLAAAAAPAGPTLQGVFRRMADAHRSGGMGQLAAALSDIIPANTVAMTQPQWVGQLWSGRAYRRRFVPLFNQAALTSYDVRGWRWTTRPAVAPYAGNKLPIPSGAVATAQVTIPAERIAGGHDVDRKHRDFNDPEFWRAYWAAMTESYARVSDAMVLAEVLSAAGAATPVGVVPAGVPRGLAAIVDGAIAILTETDTMPSFAAVGTTLWRELLLTREQDRLAYLSTALGLDEGTLTPASFTLLPSAAVDATQVLVGVRDSATVHELGGESPIRVEAEHVSAAGIDTALFGYVAVNVHDPAGLALVDTTP